MQAHPSRALDDEGPRHQIPLSSSEEPPRSSTVERKAAWLVAKGRVRPQADPAHLFEVEGMTGEYVVVLTPSLRMCTCPATSQCSHIRACILWALAKGRGGEG